MTAEFHVVNRLIPIVKCQVLEHDLVQYLALFNFTTGYALTRRPLTQVS